MAQAKSIMEGSSRKKRPGIVSKNRSSNNKNSKHYVKAYRGQGR